MRDTGVGVGEVDCRSDGCLENAAASGIIAHARAGRSSAAQRGGRAYRLSRPPVNDRQDPQENGVGVTRRCCVPIKRVADWSAAICRAPVWPMG